MRNAYFDQLDTIIDDLVSMTHQVQEAVARSTEALMTADAEIA
jgi:phosphate transport system protein